MRLGAAGASRGPDCTDTSGYHRDTTLADGPSNTGSADGCPANRANACTFPCPSGLACASVYAGAANSAGPGATLDGHADPSTRTHPNAPAPQPRD